MKFEQFIANVEEWSIIRGLNEGDPKAQYLKVVEEVGEIAAGLARGNINLTKDGIGDAFVTLIILCQKLGVEVDECTMMAWNDIKDRNGMMVNDVFIKESDFTPTQRDIYDLRNGTTKVEDVINSRIAI
jgi:NTP pyrophosphatase (non-canonical NTP hydrolase)